MSEAPQMDIDYVAKLARVDLSDDERELFGNQLSAVLEHFEKLKAANVDGIDAIAHPFPVYNVWQEDESTDCFTPEQALKNARFVKDSQVMVPKVVGDA